MSGNCIGGYYDNGFHPTPEGPKAIAEAIRVTASLTKISLAKNNLGEEGTKIICEAMKGNTTITELDLSGWGHTSNIGGAPGAKCVADMLRVTASVTSVRALGNSWSSGE